MARFHIKQTFKLDLGEKWSYVLAGQMIEGEIRAGMIVNLPFNSSFTMTARIDRIEFARVRSRPDDVCLCIECGPDELGMWDDLGLVDEQVKVSEPESSPTETS